jgi:hypothetical protein
LRFEVTPRGADLAYHFGRTASVGGP